MMTNTDIDEFVGRKLRRRRRILGLTQKELGARIGVRFQQIQKYECGANRITSSRLFELARALDVAIGYFFEGLAATQPAVAANDPPDWPGGDVMSHKETVDLVRAYYRLSERPRRRLLDLARALESEPALRPAPVLLRAQ
jgi:transcriptional regulator with XRE-family HTH domain